MQTINFEEYDEVKLRKFTVISRLIDSDIKSCEVPNILYFNKLYNLDLKDNNMLDLIELIKLSNYFEHTEYINICKHFALIYKDMPQEEIEKLLKTVTNKI